MSRSTAPKRNRKPTPGALVRWKVPVEKRIGIIDADTILYQAALKGQVMCDGEALQMRDLPETFKDALDRIRFVEGWFGDVGQVFICLTSRTNFRKDTVDPSYKAQRSPQARPLLLDELRGAFLLAATDDPSWPSYFKVFLVESLEADDVCGIMATAFQKRGYETCIVSGDKDLIQIPGMLLTPDKVGRKAVFSETTPERGEEFHMLQTLMGDPVDNYPGCPGIGKAKAAKFLEAFREMEFSSAEKWAAIMEIYEQKGKTEDDFLKQARLARILQDGDWDVAKKEVRLWNPPLA